MLDPHPLSLLSLRVPRTRSGREISGLDFACTGSPALGKCIVRGDREAGAQRCNTEPQCRGFSFFPQASEPLSILKGPGAVNATAMAVNALAVTFVKEQAQA